MTTANHDQPVLTAPNVEAARAFYASLLGWGLVEEPAVAGPGTFRFLDQGRLVAAAIQAPQSALDASLPAAWSTSTGEPPTFPTSDAALVADQAVGLGAQVLDAGGSSQVATIVDPQGAVFRLAAA